MKILRFFATSKAGFSDDDDDDDVMFPTVLSLAFYFCFYSLWAGVYDGFLHCM